MDAQASTHGRAVWPGGAHPSACPLDARSNHGSFSRTLATSSGEGIEAISSATSRAASRKAASSRSR